MDGLQGSIVEIDPAMASLTQSLEELDRDLETSDLRSLYIQWVAYYSQLPNTLFNFG